MLYIDLIISCALRLFLFITIAPRSKTPVSRADTHFNFRKLSIVSKTFSYYRSDLTNADARRRSEDKRTERACERDATASVT